MFSGLISHQGRIESNTGALITVLTPRLRAKLGESIAVNGVCLTVIKSTPKKSVSFELSPETLSKTTLGSLKKGSPVNIELTLTLKDGLGGHLVQGHVDTTGRVDRIQKQGEMKTVWFKAPPEILKYIVKKGSIAIDGVSLTIADLRKPCFSVALIPYTLRHTTLGQFRPGQRVNMEADVIGKYVAAYLKK